MPVTSIRSRLILTLTFILSAAFLTTSYVNYRLAKKAIREEILTSALPLTRDNIYSEIERDLVRPIHISSLMANDSFLKEWRQSGETDVEEIKRYLYEIKKKYGFFSTFFISTATRNYYTPDGILKRIRPDDPHDGWYYKFLGSGLEYDLVVDTNQAADDALTIFINHRVAKGDEILGVTGAGLNLDTATKLIRHYQERYRREIFLVDPEGIIQISSDPEQAGKASIYEMDGLRTVAARILSVRNSLREFEYDLGKRHYLLTTRYIRDFNWFLVVQQDETESLAVARSGFIRTLATGFATTCLVILVCVFTVNLFQSRLEHMSSTDALTGAANRRAFERRFQDATRSRSAKAHPFCFILFDLDNFKPINDELGHLAGDAILKAVTNLARDCVRPSDILSRWGGDEFLIMVMADEDHAMDIAERLERAVAEAPFGEILGIGRPLHVSISCGVAQYRDDESLDDLTARADRAMYAAKAKPGAS